MKAVVQVRGEVDQSQGVRDTLSMLNLGRVNHCTFVPERDTFRGMITKVNDWVAYGEPSKDIVETLLTRRAYPLGERGTDVDDAWVAENTEFDDVSALADALLADEVTLRDVGLSPVLRLHPPRGGHAGIKHSAAERGQLGKHTTDEIDTLLEAMR